MPNILFQGWYLDDGSIIGSVEDLVEVIRIIKEEGEKLGLILNLSKCEVWWPSIDEHKWQLFPTAIQKVYEPGIELLGCPLGDYLFVRRLLNNRIDKIEKIMAELPYLENSQC